MSFMMSWGHLRPSTLQPRDWAVPRISLMVPESSVAKNRCHVGQAILTISSKVIPTLLFIVLLISFSWFLEGFNNQGRGKRYHFHLSPSVLNGQLVSCAIILRPFQSLVALALSSPTFVGDRPRGLPLGAGADGALTSPPVYLRYTTLMSLGLSLGGMVEAAGVGWTQIQDDWKELHLGLLRADSQKPFHFLINVVWGIEIV